MMRRVDTDRVAVSGSAAERAWRRGSVHGARLWVLVCVVAWLVAALPASARAADVVFEAYRMLGYCGAEAAMTAMDDPLPTSEADGGDAGSGLYELLERLLRARAAG
jgi:hypothetical protein